MRYTFDSIEKLAWENYNSIVIVDHDELQEILNKDSKTFLWTIVISSDKRNNPYLLIDRKYTISIEKDKIKVTTAIETEYSSVNVVTYCKSIEVTKDTSYLILQLIDSKNNQVGTISIKR